MHVSQRGSTTNTQRTPSLTTQEQVLPRYWRHRKIRSFMRQLNTYGFKRCVDWRSLPTDYSNCSTHATEQPEVLEFVHQLFLRGRHDLLLKIRRRGEESSETSHPSNAMDATLGGGEARDGSKSKGSTTNSCRCECAPARQPLAVARLLGGRRYGVRSAAAVASNAASMIV